MRIAREKKAKFAAMAVEKARVAGGGKREGEELGVVGGEEKKLRV